MVGRGDALCTRRTVGRASETFRMACPRGSPGRGRFGGRYSFHFDRKFGMSCSNSPVIPKKGCELMMGTVTASGGIMSDPAARSKMFRVCSPGDPRRWALFGLGWVPGRGRFIFVPTIFIERSRYVYPGSEWREFRIRHGFQGYLSKLQECRATRRDQDLRRENVNRCGPKQANQSFRCLRGETA